MKAFRWLPWVGVFALLTSLVVHADSNSPDLTGTVLGVKDQPVPNASVFIYTAGPRVGPGYI